MANFDTLKTAIVEVIKTNGNNEITGALLQDTLLAMVDSLGTGYQFKGGAVPSTDPGTPDQKVAYFAGPGTYPNFGAVTIPEGYVGIFYGSGSTWNVATAKTSPFSAVTVSGDIIQLMDGTTPVYPRTRAEAVFFGNDQADTLPGKINQLQQEVAFIENEKVTAKSRKNLLNISDKYCKSSSILNADGTISSALARYVVSGYIPVEANTEYCSSRSGGYNGTSSTAICFYDEDRNYISGMASALNFTTPSNCAFVRITFTTETEGKMVNKGASRGKYEEYNPVNGYIGDEDADILQLQQYVGKYNVILGTVNTNVSSSSGVGIVYDLKIKQGDKFRFKISGSGSIGRFILIANGSYLNKVKDYCEFDTWYIITASLDINSLSYQVSGNPNATNVVFEMLSDISGECRQNSSDISNLKEDTTYQGNVLKNLSGEQVIALGDITSNSGVFNTIIDGLTIQNKEVFKFKITGTGSIGRFLLLCNNSTAAANRIQDNCVLNTWYTIEAPYAITSLGYSVVNDPNITGVKFYFQYKGVEYEIDTVQNSVDSLNNFSQDAVLLNRRLTGVCCKNVWGFVTNENFDIAQYIVGEGKKVRISAVCNTPLPSSAVLIRFQDSIIYSGASTGNVQCIDNVLTKDSSGHYSVVVAMPVGYPYLCISVDAGTTPEVRYVEDTIEYMSKLYDDNKFAQNVVGNNMAKASAEDLSSDLTLPDYPYANKFGDKYVFSCLVTSFSGIKICRGYQTYRARWFEIDNTNIVLKKADNVNGVLTTSTVETVAHGLTISKLLKVHVYVTDSGYASLDLFTAGGHYNHVFEGYSYDANGLLQVKNAGSTLTSCQLSAANNYFKSPIWIFGASYEGVTNQRVAGQLRNFGYFNFLLNGVAGRSTGPATEDILRALNYGRPKYLVMPIMLNDVTYANFVKKFTALHNICNSLGITLIGCKQANVPDHIDFTECNALFATLGCRCIDEVLAVSDPSKTFDGTNDVWYDGFLSSDNVHPSELGAKAIALQWLIDVPEIMQYAKDGNAPGTTPDYDGGDNVGG